MTMRSVETVIPAVLYNKAAYVLPKEPTVSNCRAPTVRLGAGSIKYFYVINEDDDELKLRNY